MTHAEIIQGFISRAPGWRVCQLSAGAAERMSAAKHDASGLMVWLEKDPDAAEGWNASIEQGMKGSTSEDPYDFNAIAAVDGVANGVDALKAVFSDTVAVQDALASGLRVAKEMAP